MSDGARRFYPEIDALKVIGILSVILIHGVRSELEPSVSEVEIWIGKLTRFAVPAFLMASGFLYATRERATAAATLRRLRRIVVPYLVASACAQLWWRQWGREGPLESLPAELLLGASFGPYYYVFVIAGLVLLTPLFARLPRIAQDATTVAFVAAGWFADALEVRWIAGPLCTEHAPTRLYDVHIACLVFWHLRSPFLWWGYFFAGWSLRMHYAPIAAWIAAHRTTLVVALSSLVLGLAVAMAADGPKPAVRTAIWLEVWAILSLQVAVFCGRGQAPAPLRFVSTATYSLYLFHLFFVYTGQYFFPPLMKQAEFVTIFVPWALGVAGPLALVALVRFFAAERSRDLIGA